MKDACEQERKASLRRALWRANARRYREKHRERVRANARARYRPVPDRDRANQLRRDFGITVMQYDKMLVHQSGVCAICGHPPKTVRLAVDHDHQTLRVRG